MAAEVVNNFLADDLKNAQALCPILRLIGLTGLIGSCV
jgi:hypothetical protein